MPRGSARLAPPPLTRRAALALVVSTALLPTAGCLGRPGTVCTLIGADSGVTVSWRPADFPAGSRYRICADGECREREDPTAGDGSTTFLQVRLPEEDGPREVAVRFTVVAPAEVLAGGDPAGSEPVGGDPGSEPTEGGRVVDAFSTRVTLRESTPNGGKCGPTVWQAGVRVDPRRGLVGGG
ncbi:hypothetical protein [Streptomyces sp. NPDC047974]|uniref:hypothetical protein n=1 Tax=Streptomyces sp. NPDC047974 TaxID=3154343 RepID=UPI0033DA5CAF